MYSNLFEVKHIVEAYSFFFLHILYLEWANGLFLFCSRETFCWKLDYRGQQCSSHGGSIGDEQA